VNPQSLAVPREQILPLTVLALFTVGFTACYFLSEAPGAAQPLRRRFGERRGAILHALYSKAWMVLCFGLLPLAVALLVFRLRLSEYGLRGFAPYPAALLTAACCAAAGAVAYFNPAHREPGGRYPSFQIDGWTPGVWLLEAASWALYILAYEFMFRGLLLYALLPWGPWPAIAVNTALYVCTHLYKGQAESIGAVFFGVLLCLLTLWTGSLWPAYLVHLSLAVFNSLGAVVRKPGLGFAGLRNTARGRRGPRG